MSTPRPPSRTARIARFTRVARVSLVCASHVSLEPHVSFVALVSELQVQGIRELVRQVALVLNEELVDTVRDVLVYLAHPILHVVDRFLARDITVCDDVVRCRFG